MQSRIAAERGLLIPSSRLTRWQGIAPTGRSVELDGIDHFVVRDGKVDSNFVVFDQLQFARQIGMMPADGSTADCAMNAAFNVKTRLLERIKR